MNRIISILLLITTGIFAQVDFSLSGYAVNMPIYQPAKDLRFVQLDDQFFNLTRIRLRPTINFSYSSRLNIEYEVNSLYTSESSFGLFNLNDVSSRRQISNLNWTIVDDENYTVNHFIDRLFFRQGFSWGNIEIGRQRISWGTGRIWNPTDLFNPINPANFAKIEKDGADAISAMIYLGSFTDLNLVYNPTNNFNESNYGFRFRTNYAEYDFALIGGYFDKRIIAGLDFAGNLFDAGIRGEGIISFDKNNSSEYFIKFILGADYQFTPEFYALIEYQFNGEGKEDQLDYEFNRLIEGDILNLSKNYIYTGLNYKFTPLLNFSLSNNINLNDRSGYFGFSANYSITADFYLIAGTQISYGSELDEYWYYPNAFYLQGEFYF